MSSLVAQKGKDLFVSYVMTSPKLFKQTTLKLHDEVNSERKKMEDGDLEQKIMNAFLDTFCISQDERYQTSIFLNEEIQKTLQTKHDRAYLDITSKSSAIINILWRGHRGEFNLQKLSSSVSISASLMRDLTLYRNQPGIGNKCFAQIGYAATAVIATAETVASIANYAYSSAFLPNNKEKSINWLSSSSFSIVWAAADFLLNPFCIVLVADEKSARKIASSGNLLKLPHGAIIR